ncbi:EamA family transporter RarD [Sphingomonas sp. G-3-2-10]|uniref:EamA family transporter RarD n=1 Tax=Sphingomonas sp. G-3-2-10 TaxID=2728838 RepID=UPI00146EC901|nr:EamA family transporter RarD [Sphingomonas sp. G-3-2-10]NML07745.1 EamA family transporter RarD [Sphingomonas sp. G-3-2-10]
MEPTPPRATGGLALGIGAYTFWGILPLYLWLLKSVPAEQVLAQRVLWSVALLAVVILLLRRGRAVLAAARGRTLLLLIGSATMIALNWLIYIWAVQHSHVLEASLGYFINPLVNVALGMMVLGERLRRVQGVAIGIAAAGVTVMAVSDGGAIWIALSLAVTFGLYGLLRKVVAIDALGGLAIETLLLAPFAIALLVYANHSGTNVWGTSLRLDLLLALAGVVTAAPLLMFAAAARRMPLSTIGLLQYIAPTIQFVLAILVFGEPLRNVHLLTFALIWTGCALYAWDSIRAMREVKI